MARLGFAGSGVITPHIRKPRKRPAFDLHRIDLPVDRRAGLVEDRRSIGNTQCAEPVREEKSGLRIVDLLQD